jgi:ubiquinone/menaquinone biosynthesis C-methylase UbiE
MLNPFRRGSNPHPLVVGMTGVKLGERLAQIGCAHGGRLAAVAAKVGLSGRAVAIVPDEASAARATAGAADAGVLVEVETAPPTRLPVEDGGFDLAVVDETGGLLRTMRAEDRGATVREVLRILRPGGRVLVIASGSRSGIAGWLARAPEVQPFDAAPELQAGGFKSVRTLAEREGLVFVEGIKPRPA